MADDAEIDAILKDAIIGTEKEIAAEAFDLEDLTLDDSGDRSLEAQGEGLEGQHEAEEEEEAEEEGEETLEAKEDETKAEEEKEETREVEGRVPSGRLREASEKARAAEAERDALKAKFEAQETESRKAISDLNAKLELLLRQQAQQPQPKVEAQAPVAPPDIFEDPVGYQKYVAEQMEARLQAQSQQFEARRIDSSMEMAKERHGDTFDAAFNALKAVSNSGPEGRQFVQRLVSSPNPGEATVKWHQRQEALKEIGSDPAAYKARVAEELKQQLAADPDFRKQLISGLTDEARRGDEGRPRNIVKLPPSLGRAQGGNGRAPNDQEFYDSSDNAIAASAWS